MKIPNVSPDWKFVSTHEMGNSGIEQKFQKCLARRNFYNFNKVRFLISYYIFLDDE